jgi:hypothetical protein
MDPIGFGFERFDVVGRQVDKENGTVPLTGDGELVGTDVDGPFRGVAALVDKLLGSAEVRRCVAAQLWELASGRISGTPRDPSAADERVAAAGVTLGAGGGLKELAVALVTTDAFLARDVSALTNGGSP